jgi:hypothetical protein
MSFWNIIKSLDFKQLWILFLWFLQHPLFMFATAKATYFTIRIAQKEFPDIHDQDNKANAFRHALWNILIAKESAKFSSDVEAVLNWTKIITDWHEEFSPNKEMARLMDLHNNQFGRNKFLDLKEKSTETIVISLKNEFTNAVQIKHPSEFKNLENQLVYLEK